MTRERLEQGETLSPVEADLFSLTCLFDDEWLHQDGPVAFFRRLESDYRQLPDRLRIEQAVKRIGEIDFAAGTEPAQVEWIVTEAASKAHRIWERADLATRLTLVCDLADLFDEVWPPDDLAVFEHPVDDSLRLLLWNQLREKAVVSLKSEFTRWPSKTQEERETLFELLEVATRNADSQQTAAVVGDIADHLVRLRRENENEIAFCEAASWFLDWLPIDPEEVQVPRLEALALQLFYAMIGTEFEAGFDIELAWDQLSDGTRRRVPGSLLIDLVQRESVDFALEELLARGGQDRQQLLLSIDRLTDKDLLSQLAEEISPDELTQLPLSCKLNLAAGIYRWWNGDESTWARLRQAVGDPVHRTEALARALADSRDPDARFLLVQVLAERGRSVVDFDQHDVTAELYDQLLKARLGDAEARGVIRSNLKPHGVADDFEELFDLLWALQPALSFDDLLARMRLEYTPTLPHALVRPILDRTKDERILECLWNRGLKSIHTDTILGALPAERLRRLAPRIIELDIDGDLVHFNNQVALAVLASDEARALLRRSADRLSLQFATALLDNIEEERQYAPVLLARMARAKDRPFAGRAKSLLIRALGDPEGWMPGIDQATRGNVDTLKRLAHMHQTFRTSGLDEMEAALSSSDTDLAAAARAYLARAGLDLSVP